ncbi:MAG: GDP-mannose 4,6-dehydratase [Pseudomonadota bacterium]
MTKTAFITGVTGQDGAYLAELLVNKGYHVHGMRRRTSQSNSRRVKHLLSDLRNGEGELTLHYADMTDASAIMSLISDIRPDEVYNLAAQSHVQVSFENPEYTADADALGVVRILEAIRLMGLKDTRFFQASTSEMFGNAPETPQHENTVFQPASPYAAAKLYAYWLVRNYRDGYGLHASNGIMFNHESPLRGRHFVTRKVTRGVAAIHLGKQEKLLMGNLSSKRDWGHAADFVKGMWQMLQQDAPGDYVLATGQTHSVRHMIELAFSHVDRTIEWVGQGVDEKGLDTRNGQILVEVDTNYFRPVDVQSLRGDAAKAKAELGWQPEIALDALIEEMVHADLADLQAEQQSR